MSKWYFNGKFIQQAKNIIVFITVLHICMHQDKERYFSIQFYRMSAKVDMIYDYIDVHLDDAIWKA